MSDQNAVAGSARVYWSLPDGYGGTPSSEIPTILARLAKPVLPDQLIQAVAQLRGHRDAPCAT